MKINKMIIAASMAAAVALPSAASAVTIDGITYAPGVTLVVGKVFEGRVTGGLVDGNVITAAGQELGGIGFIDSINDKNGNSVWTAGTNGKELTFQFGGYIAERITPIDVPPTPGVDFIAIDFSGGWVNFYSDTSGGFNAGLSIAAATAEAIDGTEWLNYVGASTGAVCDISCVNPGADITLASVIFGSSLLNIGSGSGNGFLNVDMSGMGSANNNFNTNAIGGKDAALGSSFNTVGTNGSFPAGGSIDIKTVAIPEPGSIALLGLGLLGFAASRRRKA